MTRYVSSLYRFISEWHLPFRALQAGILLLCLAIPEALPARTQLVYFFGQSDSLNNRVYRHEIGIGIGTTTGTGLAYRIWRKKLGLQVLILPYHTAIVEHYTFGFTLMHTLVRNPVSNLFLYQSNRYRSSTDYRVMDGPWRNGGYSYTSAKTIDWANGLGLGYEILIGKGTYRPLGISMMTGWGFYRTFTRVNLSGEIGVVYKFR